MAVKKNTRVILNQEMSNIYNKGFRISKNTGDGAHGLILALTTGYFDSLVLAKDTEYDSFYFIESYLEPVKLNYPDLIGFVDWAKQQNINDFTIYCKDPENLELILKVGKFITGITEHQNKNEIDQNIENFSRTFNVQVHIHSGFNNEVKEYKKNRLTDALIINIFKTSSQGIDMFSSLYVQDFSVLNEQNNNVTKEFTKESENINGNYIPIRLTKALINEVAKYVLDNENTKDIAEKYEKLKNETGDIWEIFDGIDKIFEKGERCYFCNVMKKTIKLSCEHSFCTQCVKINSKSGKCSTCNKVMRENEKQEISQLE